MVFYNMLYEKEQNLNYASYANKDTSSELRLGRPRSVSIFEDVMLTLKRFRLGLSQNDHV